ncbi:uncharacterized protein LOC135938484 isoform X2 [Cloeon dipterum]
MNSAPAAGQGMVALLVMVAIVCLVLVYYCWGACCRSICPRRASSLELDPEFSQPTIILLPYGRMVVVDSRLFNQLQAGSGLDLTEIGRQMTEEADSPAETPDSEAKDRLTALLMPPPPAYESIFGLEDNPPSYEDLLRRQRVCILTMEPQPSSSATNSDCGDDSLRESSV